MKRIIFLSIALLFCTIVTAQNAVVPDKDILNVYGKKINLRAISKGATPVVLAFWATWCVPCVKELDAINEVIEDWKEQTDMKFFAVSVDDSRTVKRVRPMVNGKDWDFDILLDTNNDLKRALNIINIPHVVIVKDNKIVYRHSGYQPGSEQELYTKIEHYAKD